MAKLRANGKEIIRLTRDMTTVSLRVKKLKRGARLIVMVKKSPDPVWRVARKFELVEGLAEKAFNNLTKVQGFKVQAPLLSPAEVEKAAQNVTRF